MKTILSYPTRSRAALRRLGGCVALSLCILSVPPAPAAAQAAEGSAEAFARAIEKAHGLESWSGKEALQTDFRLAFGPQVLEGRLLFRPDMSASRLEVKGGPVLVHDGESAWVSPAAAPFPQARFHLLTWPYFAAVPMKLRDPGAKLELMEEKPLQAGQNLPAARLTFAPGTGDTPDDWYVVYREPGTNRLKAVAYIVTYGKSAEEAEKEPHALLYEDFQTVDGVTLSTSWKFYNWNQEQGVHGDPLGEMSFSNLRFVTPPADAFQRPADSKEDPLP